jgi:hypothetical protein
MENTIDLTGFNLIIDDGTCYFNIIPISNYSKANDLFEALDYIKEKTGKDTDVFTINEEEKTIHVYLSV